MPLAWPRPWQAGDRGSRAMTSVLAVWFLGGLPTGDEDQRSCEDDREQTAHLQTALLQSPAARAGAADPDTNRSGDSSGQRDPAGQRRRAGRTTSSEYPELHGLCWCSLNQYHCQASGAIVPGRTGSARRGRNHSGEGHVASASSQNSGSSSAVTAATALGVKPTSRPASPALRSSFCASGTSAPCRSRSSAAR